MGQSLRLGRLRQRPPDPDGGRKRLHEGATGAAGGKKVALQVLSRGGLPTDEEAAHPLIQKTRNEALSARTAWRMRWQIPLNDPRFQDVTDEEILEDLLVCRFYDHVTQPPETQDAEEVAAAMEDPEVKQKIWDHGSKFLLDPDTQRRLAILQGKQPDTKPRKVAP